MLVAAVAVGSHGQELFQPAPGVYEHPAPLDPQVLRIRSATLDRDVLLASLADGSRLVLNLFPDAAFEGRVVESRSGSLRTAFLYADLDGGGRATLFIGDGVVRGEVHTPRGVYTIRSGSDGKGVRITQLDRSKLPRVDGPSSTAFPDAARRNWRPGVGPPLLSSDDGEEEEEEDFGPDETVDLLVFYTPSAEVSEGGRAQTEATIIAEIAKTNQAFANSGLGHRTLRLVAVRRMNVDAEPGSESWYGRVAEESDDVNFASLIIDRKGTYSDPYGVLDGIHEARGHHAADVMYLFFAEPVGTCGWTYSYALHEDRWTELTCSSYGDLEECHASWRKRIWRGGNSIGFVGIPPGCAALDTFTHELGHNFGLKHDRYSQDKYDRLTLTPHETYARLFFPLRPYGFGYVNQNFDRPVCYRTIMAYGDQCIDEGYGGGPSALMFSNPDLEIGDEDVGFDPAGIPGDEWTEDLDGPVNASRAIDDVWDIVANLHSATEDGHHVPLMPSASDPSGRQGFVRVVNHTPESGEVTLEAFDDEGSSHGPVTLSIGADRIVHVNSDDLAAGNAGKGMPDGIGAVDGDLRLKLTSTLEIEVLAYVRTHDGFLTAMHDLAPAAGPGLRAAFFNPASNANQVSKLRIVNPREEDAAVTITGTDDAGVAGGEIRSTIPARGARTFTAQELEAGAEGLDGSLGDGTGKWRLFVEAEKVRADRDEYGIRHPFPWIQAMSLMESPTGHLTNLSAVPRNEYQGTHTVPLFPAKTALNRQGFARVVNHTDEAAEVAVLAYDDDGTEHGPVTLSLDANETAHFNSADLEDGNEAKGLSGGVGSGTGDWRLQLTSESDIEVLAYVRTDDGFVTTMHDAAPSLIHTHRVAVFNPGSNANQVSSLRLANPGDTDAEVTITGVDDDGESPGSEITVTVPGKASMTFTSRELEAGASGSEGSLGDGRGKWQLEIHADREIVAMSVLESPTGHLTNLSTAPVRGAGPVPDAAAETAPEATPGSKFRGTPPVFRRPGPGDGRGSSGDVPDGLPVRRCRLQRRRASGSRGDDRTALRDVRARSHVRRLRPVCLQAGSARRDGSRPPKPGGRRGLGPRTPARHQRVLAGCPGLRGVAFARDGGGLPAGERG